jgi:hypothetical protein
MKIQNKFNLYENGIKNIIPSKEITIFEFLDLLKSENKLVELIRLEQDKAKRDLLKQKLSYVTFAGCFTKRTKKALIKGSGFACFDIDDVENLDDIKQQIIKNKYTHCLFISPSGNGLKCIVKIPEVKSDEEYKQYWISIARHYDLDCNDEANKDISRACYLSFDKSPYFNPNSEIYLEKVEDVLKPIAKERQKGGQGGVLLSQNSDEAIHVNKEIAKTIGKSNEFLDKLKSNISMESVLREFGVDTSMNPTICPFHHCSQRCLSFNSEICNCFDTDCNQGYNIFSFVKKVKNYSSAEAIEWLSDFAGMKDEYEKSKQEYLSKNEMSLEPKGWALSINIRRMAERYDLLNCPECDTLLLFNERMGFFKCKSCKEIYGGLKRFAVLCHNKKLSMEVKQNEHNNRS